MVRLKPEESFVPAINEAFGAESVIVVRMHNGQSIRRWYKGWKTLQGTAIKSSGDLYDNLITKVKTAIEGREIETVTLLWMQGEADAAGNQVGVYKKSFEGLLDQLRKDLDQKELRFVIGRLSDYTLDTGKHPEWPAMRKLQMAMADADPLGAWIDTDDLNNMTDANTGKLRNDVHYTPEGYKIFGQRLAEKAIALTDPHSPG